VRARGSLDLHIYVYIGKENKGYTWLKSRSETYRKGREVDSLTIYPTGPNFGWYIIPILINRGKYSWICEK
jgi:hypothetical protein